MGSLLAWIVTGFVAGLLARWVTRDDRSGCIYTIVIGVLGAVIAGAVMQAIDARPLDEFSLRTVFVAALGAIALLVVLQTLSPFRRRRRY